MLYYLIVYYTILISFRTMLFFVYYSCCSYYFYSCASWFLVVFIEQHLECKLLTFNCAYDKKYFDSSFTTVWEIVLEYNL